MTVILTFLAALLIVIGWWLSRQRLLSRPWLESGPILAGQGASALAPGKLGLGVFLAVVGGLFAMLGSAFVMQIEETPWQQVPLPGVVWASTGVLVLGSLCMEYAAWSARRGDARMLHAALAAGGVSALAFLGGQLMAWSTLTSGGYALDGTPAASFFYLITGLHGLHILGGLVAMGAVWLRLAGADDVRTARSGVALCALYWHALLVVWIVLFALLAGWGNEFLAICRAVLN